MIVQDTVYWEKATAFPGATHIIDFGPGGVSGIGGLTHRNKEGKGIRVILASLISGTVSNIGYKGELFDQFESSIVYNMDWAKEFGPKLIKTATGQNYVSTKMSRLLALPPIMVAGMTPTTVSWDFVSAAINSGYHIELAGGGYHNEAGMAEALEKIATNIQPGRGITVNVLYVSPRALSWQIPLIRKLCDTGMPIDGLTVGAGVPSLEVATEYIETIELKHISFKPGSVEGIQAVINISNAHPTFPNMLQWTGGRAGGHHSFEDFHQPIHRCIARMVNARI